MAAGDRTPPRALVQSSSYVETSDRLNSKYRRQVHSKVMDLTHNPLPGGSKTALVGYSGLYRVRAGDFRVIYAFDDHTVQVLTLRRRNEATYDHLDDLEVQDLKAFRAIKGANGEGYNIPKWEELAENWAAPVPKPAKTLPREITEEMLRALDISEKFWPPLLAVVTEEQLIDCDQVPDDVLTKVIYELLPIKERSADLKLLPVVVVSDLIDDKAAMIAGPVDLGNEIEAAPAPSGTGKTSKKGPAQKKVGKPARTKVPLPLVFVSTRKQTPMTPYLGNTARKTGKDARYTVKLDNSIQLDYTDTGGNNSLLTTDDHPELVALVNEAKRKGGSSQGGGGFLINEYRHVLVPTQSGKVLHAGAYTKDLEFKYRGKLVSPVAPSGTRPGAIWPGPHVGVRYTLAAGASDIRYEAEKRNGDQERVSLSDYYSVDELDDLLGMFRAVKPKGGAVYINEARELFAPVDDGEGYKRRYIGHLGDRPWFPEPD